MILSLAFLLIVWQVIEALSVEELVPNVAPDELANGSNLFSWTHTKENSQLQPLLKASTGPTMPDVACHLLPKAWLLQNGNKFPRLLSNQLLRHKLVMRHLTKIHHLMKKVGSHLVGQYYQILRKQPELAHQFYTDSSAMIQVDGDSTETATDLLAQRRLLLLLGHLIPKACLLLQNNNKTPRLLSNQLLPHKLVTRHLMKIHLLKKKLAF